MLLNNTHVLRLCKAFANNSSANIKSSKTQLHKRGQSWGFFGRPLGLFLKSGLPLMQNVLKPLTKSILIPLGLRAAASAADAAIHKKMFGSVNRTLIVSTFEIQKYYQNKPQFNYVYSRNNLPKKMMRHM